MSIDFDSAATSALNSTARGGHWLVECDFTTGTYYATTAPINVDSPNGHTYIGLGNFLQIEEVKETSKADTETLNLRMGIINKALLAVLTGDQSAYRGRDIRLYMQIFTEKFAPIGQPKMRWAGVMNPIKINREKPSSDNGQTYGYIEMPCARHGMQRSRHNKGIRMTHQQHLKNYPGDLFFQHMGGLIKEPAPWLTVAFQKIS